MKKLYLMLFICLLSFCAVEQVFAQKRKEVRLGIAYEQPLGELAWVYKPTPGFALRMVTPVNKYEQTTGGIDLGYVSFKPKEDTLFFLVGEKEYGTAVYGSYDIYQFGLSVHHEFIRATKLTPYAGCGLGMYFIKSEYVIDSPVKDVDAYSLMINAAIYPKAGLSYKFNDQAGIYLEGKYQLFAETGTNDSQGLGYNPNLGQYNYNMSYGIGGFYRFK